MEEFISKICPYCKTDIREGDAVKVCPVCGTAHHEVCWIQNKGCAVPGCGWLEPEQIAEPAEAPEPEQIAEPAETPEPETVAEPAETPEPETVAEPETPAAPALFCSNCGTPLDEGHDFCPKCGTPKAMPQKRLCPNCGTELGDGHDFCPKCGTRYDPNPRYSAPAAAPAAPVTPPVTAAPKKNKALVPIIAAVALVALALILFFVLRGTPVSEVSFNKNSLELVEGKTATLVCTVSPDNAKDKSLTWKSSNESIATVDQDGLVTAIAEGNCTITVSSKNGKTDECRVTVEKAGPDLKALYNEYCKSTWATVGSDGSYLSLDTNPFNKDDDGLAYPDAYYAIKKINAALGLPDSLIEDMGQTTWSMGKQSETFNSIGITVSWTYHPDKGLEVTYKLINN